MATLRDALASTDGLSKARRPPNLREARGQERCGTCRWFKGRLMSGAGVCRLYAGYAVQADDVSDAYQPKGT
jgi:hypothetical protein